MQTSGLVDENGDRVWREAEVEALFRQGCLFHYTDGGGSPGHPTTSIEMGVEEGIELDIEQL